MNDPELSAMAALAAALEPLDDTAKERVIRWARDRYAKSSPPRETVAQVSPNRHDILPREQGDAQFTDAAGVYDSANPSSDGEKVLVVGYWFQAVRGETELDSQSINTELKNLGYPIGNVTRAVSSLAKTTPRYIVQTKKSGSSQQARKKFRLTVEGIRRVEQMLGGSMTKSALAPGGGTSHDDDDA